MPRPDLTQALSEIEPKTKAAKVRQVMPIIEQKIKAGVRIADILQTLKASGIELSEATLKSYLYRHRKRQGATAAARTDTTPLPTSSVESSAIGTTEQQESPNEPVSMQELERLMKPDPAKQAGDLARYERIAKQQRRSRKQ
jgi:hypothetical protein